MFFTLAFIKPALGLFLVFVALTLVITWFSARKAKGSAGRRKEERGQAAWAPQEHQHLALHDNLVL